MVDDYVDKYGRKIAQPMLLIRGGKDKIIPTK